MRLQFAIPQGIIGFLLSVQFIPIRMATTKAGAPPADAGAEIAYREPFTLKLMLDRKNVHIEEIGREPYVKDGEAHVFLGDDFGVAFDIQDGEIKGVHFEPNPDKADMPLKLIQQLDPRGVAAMTLIYGNNSKQKFLVDVVMILPGQKEPRNTSVSPMGPGRFTFKTWPHPIVQLIFRNFRLKK